MRTAIYIAAAIIVAGCTTKTVEREIYYVPAPAPTVPAPTITPSPSYSRTEAANLAFCARLFARVSQVLTRPEDARKATSQMYDTILMMYDLGVRQDDPVIDDAVKEADMYISDPGGSPSVFADVFRACMRKIGWATEG